MGRQGRHLGLVHKLTTDVDVSGDGTHGSASNEATLDEPVWIRSHDFTILAGARFRLVGINHHFRPEGKPAPPRPRSPEDLISSMIQSGPIWTMSLVWCQIPRFSAPLR